MPRGLSQVIIGERDLGERLVDNHDVALVSATGSTRMGREVGPRVAARFGRSLLELGGNNAIIVTPSAVWISLLGAFYLVRWVRQDNAVPPLVV